jgi:hypothetical protein
MSWQTGKRFFILPNHSLERPRPVRRFRMKVIWPGRSLACGLGRQLETEGQMPFQASGDSSVASERLRSEDGTAARGKSGAGCLRAQHSRLECASFLHEVQNGQRRSGTGD